MKNKMLNGILKRLLLTIIIPLIMIIELLEYAACGVVVTILVILSLPIWILTGKFLITEFFEIGIPFFTTTTLRKWLNKCKFLN